MSILELLQQDNIEPQLKLTSKTKEYCSPCPKCGGTDRFIIWPDQDIGGRFWCRQCKFTGNAIDYLRKIRKLPFSQACKILGYIPGHQKAKIHLKSKSNLPDTRTSKSLLPPSIWREKLSNFVSQAHHNLSISAHGSEILQWLNNRGLNLDTIKNFKLGWNLEKTYIPRNELGLPDEGNSDVLIPAGLIIPYYLNDELIRIRVRLTNSAQGQKYHIVAGSVALPMVLGHKDYYIVVESELDGLLIHQESHDLIGAVALGSVSIKPDGELKKILSVAKQILVSLDSDMAGANIALDWWKKNFKNSKRWLVPVGKDPSEAYQQKVPIRQWIIAGVPEFLEQYEAGLIGDQAEVQELPSEPGELPYQIIADGQALREVIKSLNTAETVAVSIQTTGADPFTSEIHKVIIAIADSPVFAIDVEKLTEGDLALVRVIFGSRIRKIFFNAKTSLKFLKIAGYEVSDPIFDVLIAEQLLILGLGKPEIEFKDLVEKYLGGFVRHPVIQSSGNAISHGHNQDDQLSAIAIDTELLLKLYEVLDSELEKAELVQAAQLEFSCLRAVADLELNGMKIDTDKLTALNEALKSEKERLETILYAELGKINLDSPEQVKEVLKTKNIPVPDTNQGTLKALSERYPILDSIIKYRHMKTAINTFSDKLPEHVNSSTVRIHPNYWQLGAKTGRFSCKNPNLQQIPRGKEFRELFIPEVGHKYVIADYSQIELRVLAELSSDPVMIQAYIDGIDLHALTASRVLEKPLADVSKKERQAAKAINFGLIYAMGAKGLQGYARNTFGVKMTLDEAEKFRQKFFRVYSGVDKWQKKITHHGCREIRTLSGRRRLWSDEPKITELFNTPVQGTAADIVKMALVLLTERVVKVQGKIIGVVHDEIILEVPDNMAEEAKALLEETMKQAGAVFLKKIPCEVEVVIADNWAGK